MKEFTPWFVTRYMLMADAAILNNKEIYSIHSFLANYLSLAQFKEEINSSYYSKEIIKRLSDRGWISLYSALDKYSAFWRFDPSDSFRLQIWRINYEKD